MPTQRKTVELVLDAFFISPTPLVAIGIGERDLMMGGEWLINALEERRLPHVISNLECDGLEFVASRVHTQEDISIEFVSFVSSTLLDKEPMGELLRVSSMLPKCTATEPAQWLAEHPKQADIRVAFADLNRNEIASIAPFVDIVIETKIGKTTPEPEVLDTKTVLFGVGSKGQNLGVLSWTYDPTKSGFTSGGLRVAKESELTRKLERLKTLEMQRNKVSKQDPEYKKLQRQYDYTQRSITVLENELSSLPLNNDTTIVVSSNLVSLNRDIANHAGMEQIIKNAHLAFDDTK